MGTSGRGVGCCLAISPYVYAPSATHNHPKSASASFVNTNETACLDHAYADILCWILPLAIARADRCQPIDCTCAFGHVPIVLVVADGLPARRTAHTKSIPRDLLQRMQLHAHLPDALDRNPISLDGDVFQELDRTRALFAESANGITRLIKGGRAESLERRAAAAHSIVVVLLTNDFVKLRAQLRLILYLADTFVGSGPRIKIVDASTWREASRKTITCARGAALAAAVARKAPTTVIGKQVRQVIATLPF